MMTTMICSDCGEAKVVTSRSVSLPFVCDSCCEQIEDFQQKIAPAELNQLEASEKAVAAAYMTSYETPIADPAGLATETIPGAPAFPEEDRTGLLIADLEQQLLSMKAERNFLLGRLKIVGEQRDSAIQRQEELGKKNYMLARQQAYQLGREFDLVEQNEKLKAELAESLKNEEAVYKKLDAYIQDKEQQDTELRNVLRNEDFWKSEAKTAMARLSDIQQRFYEEQNHVARLEAHPWKNLLNYLRP